MSFRDEIWQNWPVAGVAFLLLIALAWLNQERVQWLLRLPRTNEQWTHLVERWLNEHPGCLTFRRTFHESKGIDGFEVRFDGIDVHTGAVVGSVWLVRDAGTEYVGIAMVLQVDPAITSTLTPSARRALYHRLRVALAGRGVKSSGMPATPDSPLSQIQVRRVYPRSLWLSDWDLEQELSALESAKDSLAAEIALAIEAAAGPNATAMARP
ncbi:MAG: hypothetical protein M0R73_09185 [Dehalococcoidia bacterium]|nr:hypothetical protein [Dehalococcoidia bacterium]